MILPIWPPDWPEIRAAVAASLQSGDWGRYQSELCDQLSRSAFAPVPSSRLPADQQRNRGNRVGSAGLSGRTRRRSDPVGL